MAKIFYLLFALLPLLFASFAWEDQQRGCDCRCPGSPGSLTSEDLIWYEEDDYEIVEDEKCTIFDTVLSRQGIIALVRRLLTLLESPEEKSKRKRLQPLDEQAIRLYDSLSGTRFTFGDMFTPDDDAADLDWEPEPESTHIGQYTDAQKRAVIKSKDVDGRTHKQINKMYPWYKGSYMLKRFRESLARGGGGQTRRDMLQQINERTRAEFNRVRGTLGIVQGWMIRRWARQHAIEIGARWFKASEGWLFNFNRRNKLSSRKITRFRGRAEVDKEDQMHRNVEDFKRQFAELRPHFQRRFFASEANPSSPPRREYLLDHL